jgi:hypothetical protein
MFMCGTKGTAVITQYRTTVVFGAETLGSRVLTLSGFAWTCICKYECVCVCVYVYECMCVCVCVCVCVYRHVTVSTRIEEVLPHVLTSTEFCETLIFTPLTGKSSGYNVQLQFHFKLHKSRGSLRGIETLCLWYYFVVVSWYKHLRYKSIVLIVLFFLCILLYLLIQQNRCRMLVTQLSLISKCHIICITHKDYGCVFWFG